MLYFPLAVAQEYFTLITRGQFFYLLICILSFLVPVQALESKLASCRNFVKDQPKTIKTVGLANGSSSDSSR